MNRTFGYLPVAAAALLVASANASATVTTDLWDINQGATISQAWTAGAYPGSDLRNMFGGSFGSIEIGNAVFMDAQIFGPGTVALLSWQTPQPVALARFVLQVAADGAYPYEPSTAVDPLKYARSIEGFNLYAGDLPRDVYADWGQPVYASGLLAAPLGTYAGGIYSYTIDHEFPVPVTAQHFKADFIYGSYYTGPRIIELDGFGATPPVPEPSSALLIGAGLFGGFLMRRRKTRM
jgi:hypothetical protein